MFLRLVILCVVCVVPWGVSGHTYHLGSCPAIDAANNFKIRKFVGDWHVIYKTKPAVDCLTYEVSAGRHKDQYMVHELSNYDVKRRRPIDDTKKYYYDAGNLTVHDFRRSQLTSGRRAEESHQKEKDRHHDKSSDHSSSHHHHHHKQKTMQIEFLRNMIGPASFIVFDTDNRSYIAIFMCQTVAFGHRRAVVVLSKSRYIKEKYLKKILKKLRKRNVSYKHLEKIQQKKKYCTFKPRKPSYKSKTSKKKTLKSSDVEAKV